MKTMNPRVDPAEVFPQVEKMIYSLAWKTAQTYPVPYEEALCEAYYAFMKACYDFNPSKGSKFSSWCYFWIWTKLKDMVTARVKDPHIFIEIDDDLTGEAPPTRSPALEIVEELSDDAKEIIQLLLETPKEILKNALTPEALLRKVERHLMKIGRSAGSIEWAKAEIRRKLTKVWATA